MAGSWTRSRTLTTTADRTHAYHDGAAVNPASAPHAPLKRKSTSSRPTSWHDGHHAMLAEQLGLSQGLLRRRESWIRENLASMDLGKGPISVRGPNGVAFTLER